MPQPIGATTNIPAKYSLFFDFPKALTINPAEWYMAAEIIKLGR